MNSNAQAAARIHHMVPVEGKHILVDLPGERTRATVRKVVSPDVVVVELTSIISQTGKSHWYRRNQIVAAKRGRNEFEEVWEVLDEAALRSMENAYKLAEEAATPAPAPPEPVQDAASAGKQQGDDLEQHRRDGSRRPSAKASRSGSPKQRKASPKG